MPGRGLRPEMLKPTHRLPSGPTDHCPRRRTGFAGRIQLTLTIVRSVPRIADTTGLFSRRQPHLLRRLRHVPPAPHPHRPPGRLQLWSLQPSGYGDLRYPCQPRAPVVFKSHAGVGNRPAHFKPPCSYDRSRRSFSLRYMFNFDSTSPSRKRSSDVFSTAS